MAGIKDVAKKAGVSISTVSNVINGTKFVSEDLAKKIQQVIAELRYEADPVARSLKSKKSMTIGVVITNINRIFFPQVIRGIQDEANRNGYNLTLCNTDDSVELEKRYVQMLESNWVDGIILDTVADQNDKGYFKRLATLGSRKKAIPVVSLERRLDPYGIPSVVVNNEYGGSLATRHLIECGCKKIVHVTGPVNFCMVQDRLNGYRNELGKGKLPVVAARIVTGDFSPLSGYQAVKELLGKGVKFDGIVAANDQMAIGAMKAVKEQGLRIPEEVRVIGFDNTFIASITEPSLTTINVPKYKLGAMAAEILMRRINRENVSPGFVELPVDLVVRRSSDAKGDQNWELTGW